MGKIFGISKLPVSTIDKALNPVPDIMPKPHWKRIKNPRVDLLKTPLKDGFVKSPKGKPTKV